MFVSGQKKCRGPRFENALFKNKNEPDRVAAQL
jgi:hypothetical protein